MKCTPTRMSLMALVVAMPLTVTSAAFADTTPTAASGSPTASSTRDASPTLPEPTPSLTPSTDPSSSSTEASSPAPSTPTTTSSSPSAPSSPAPSSPSPSTSATPTGPKVGSHVKKVVDASLGSPVGAEAHWASAGGGWAQRFERGWALVADDGRGGRVTGSLLPYFTSHGNVNATGWPTGNAVTDAAGTYQMFDTKGHATWGGLATTPSGGVVRVGMGIATTYFGGKLRATVGAPLGEEVVWASGGGGHAQNFANGWVTYQSSKVSGWFPSSFTFAQLDLATKGWPTSGPSSACGAQKVSQTKGYTATGDRWCPSSSWMAQPVATIVQPGMPGVLYSHAYYAARGLTRNKDAVVGDGGLNVYFAQQALKVKNGSRWSTLDATTSSAIKAYQTRTPELSATGNLDAKTFTTLTHRDWKAGTQTTQVHVGFDATLQQRIDGEIAFAQRMTSFKRPYIYGAGSEEYGMDCSGLALAALQAAGVDMRAVNILKDVVYPEWMANAMWSASGLPRVNSLNGVKRGDLVFFSSQGARGRATHVAIAADDGARTVYQSTDLPRVFGVEKVALGRVGAGTVLGYIRPIQ